MARRSAEADADEADLPPGGLGWDEVFWCEAADGKRLRAAVWNAGARRGHVVVCTGRTEFLEKLALPAAELARRGFAVASVDWRGQGLSDRLLQPRLKGHIADFLQYHQDLAALLGRPEVMALRGPRLVLGHSMGGAVALGAILRERLEARALILSAPMLGIRLSRQMRWAAALTMQIARLTRRLESWPPFGDVNVPYVFSEFEGNVLTSDRALYEWMAATLRRQPDLQLAMPTIGWVRAATEECRAIAAAGPLDIPSLCLIGSQEKVVDADAVRAGAARLGADLVEIEGAEHELLLERQDLRARAWDAIDAFLGRNGL